MKNIDITGKLDNLHKDYLPLLEVNKLHMKSAVYIAALDIHAEQLWVLRFYNEHGILPTIKQAKELKEMCQRKKLTLKAFKSIMSGSLKPQKLVFNYSDFTPYFEENTPVERMKEEVLKVLSNWKNKK